MPRTAIITDSSAYIPKDILKTHNIHVIPLTILWGKESLLDDVDITPDEFLERLSSDPVYPSTTQPNPVDFANLYQELASEYDGIVNVLISSRLSGTVSSAQTAANEFNRVPVRVVDTKLTTMGQGFAVLAAARAAANGESVDQVAKAAEKEAAQAKVMFVVNTLKYLHKGGRIGGASKLLGSVLSLKPLLHINHGQVDSLERIRTKTQAVNRMLELGEAFADGQTVRAAVIHTGVPDEARILAQRVADRFDCVEQYTAGISPAISVHTGPGAIGLVLSPASSDRRE